MPYLQARLLALLAAAALVSERAASTSCIDTLATAISTRVAALLAALLTHLAPELSLGSQAGGWSLMSAAIAAAAEVALSTAIGR